MNFFSLLVFGYFVMANYKTYGLISHPNDKYLTILGCTSFAFFGCSRYLWTKLINKLEFKKSFYLIILSQVRREKLTNFQIDNKIITFNFRNLLFIIFFDRLLSFYYFNSSEVLNEQYKVSPSSS